MEMPPVSPRSRELPFEAKEFTWATFEGFFCDFLASQPTLLDAEGNPVQVIHARPYGRKGDKQDGIDIEAKMANGETWAFQCKHYPKASWTPSKTRKAIEQCVYPAQRKFLLITREVSEECRKVVTEHTDWELWDSRKISSEFLNRVDALKGAGILYRNFGPGWAEAFFDLPTSLPLIGAEARFFKLLQKGRSFHHRHPLIGRAEELRQLQTFVKSKGPEVLLLLGRAGLGKSRLLLEFSRTFSRKHKGSTLYFVSDEAADSSAYKKAIDAAPKPLVLVFDDAHSFKEIRKALFPVTGKRDDVKLVLSLRPGPTNQIRKELGFADYDTQKIEELPAMGELSPDEARKLAETIVGKNREPSIGQFFANLARESPLIAVMGAELWKSGALVDRDLCDTPQFRDRILSMGFESDIEPLFGRYGEETVRTFAKLLALLGPVKFEGDFLERVATFPGFMLRPDQVRDLGGAFDQAGLLYESEAGFRIVPDLLSDHLAFDACYDGKGRDKTFALQVITHFDAGNFPQIIQHLAEAEWQASRRTQSNVSIMDPVWSWFEERFRNASFCERRKQLDEWADIAHFQAERTIQLAELAIQLKEVPVEKDELLSLYWVREFDTHEHVIAGIPDLLTPLANSHPNFTGRCFDILWKLGKDLEPPMLSAREKSHPILVMGEIAKFEFWKSFEIARAALDWVKKRVSDSKMSGNVNRPSFLLATLLKPFFSLVSEETWGDTEKLYFRTHLMSLDLTAPFRAEVLSLCREILTLRDLPLALGVVAVLETAMRPLWIRFDGKPSSSQLKEWDEERKKALDLVAHILETWDDPLLHFQIRRKLSRELAFSKSSLIESVRPVFESIPDTAALRLARVSLSYGHDEFHEDINKEGWQDRMKDQWRALVALVADELVGRHLEPDDILGELRRFEQHAAAHEYCPNFGPLLSDLSERHSRIALNMANRLIDDRIPNSGEWLRCLIGNATRGNIAEHVRLCRDAIATGESDLVAGAIESLGRTRRFEGKGKLPDEAWNLIFTAVADADERVFRAAMQFLWINDNEPTQRDWDLLGTFADPGTDELRELLARRCLDLLQDGSPPPGSPLIEKVLSVCIGVKSVDSANFDFVLRGIAERFPAEVYHYFWKRIECGAESNDSNYSAVPLEVETYPFRNISGQPELAELIETLTERLLNGRDLDVGETRLLRAVLRRSEDIAESFLGLIGKISTQDQLHTMIDFSKNNLGWPLILSEPDLARALLLKSRSVGGEDAYRDTFKRLSLLSGCRSSANGEPDPEWHGILESAERLAHRFSDEPDLGPLYRAAVEFERSAIERNRQDHVERRGRR